MANGVKLATAYIDITADTSQLDKQIGDALNQLGGKHGKIVGQQIGKDLSTGIRDGMKSGAGGGESSVITDILGGKSGSSSARTQGAQYGKEIGAGIIQGINSSTNTAASASGGILKDIGKIALDEFKGVAKDWGKTILTEVASGQVHKAFNDVGDTVKGVTTDIYNMGTSIGVHLDAVKGFGENAATWLDNLGTKAGGISDKLIGAADGIKKIHEGDTAGKLQGVSIALGAISEAGKDLTGHDFSGTVKPLQDIANTAGGIAGTVTALKELKGIGSFSIAVTIGILGGLEVERMLDRIKFIHDRFYNSDGSYKNPIDRLLNGQPLAQPGSGNVAPGAVPTTPNVTPGTATVPGAGGPPPTVGGIPIPGLKPGHGGPANAPSSNTSVPPPQQAHTVSSVTSAGNTVSAGVYTGPDQGGAFPQWVTSVGSRFNINPSTYGGHQTTNRQEPGFAPNPQGYNRGIDWKGSPADLQRFAEFAAANPQLFEQVIWNNPQTGQHIGVAGGRIVGDAYYAGDWGGHTDHVHTRFSQGFQFGPPAASPPMVILDSGGLLDPGVTLAINNTGQPEVVIPADQLKTADALKTADPQPNTQTDQAKSALDFARTAGFIPTGAGSSSVAGTSFVAGLLNLGNEAVGGLIDTGASAAQMALSAGANMAAPGSGAAASAAGGIGIQLAANEAKRAVSWGFQMGAIGADALIEQAFSMFGGAPRWIGYDYTQFMPHLDIGAIGTTTVEKAMQAATQQGGQGGQPGGPVEASHLPGAQPVGPPLPKFGSPAAPLPAPGVTPGATPDLKTAAPVPPPPGPPPDLKTAGPPQPDLFTNILGMDDGGWLPHGSAAFNTSGRPELVLSPSTLDSIAAPTRTRGGRGDNYYITAVNAEDVGRQIDKRKTLAAMRYTGRP